MKQSLVVACTELATCSSSSCRLKLSTFFYPSKSLIALEYKIISEKLFLMILVQWSQAVPCV